MTGKVMKRAARQMSIPANNEQKNQVCVLNFSAQIKGVTRSTKTW